MKPNPNTEIHVFVRDPRTGSCVARLGDGPYVALIWLRGKWRRFAQSADLDDAHHYYACARMTLYGESWEQASEALRRHILPEPELAEDDE